MKMENVQPLGPEGAMRRRASTPGMHFLAEARKVDIPQAQRAVNPEALAQCAPDHAVER